MKMLTRKILSVLCFALVLALIVPGFSGAAGTKPRTEKSGQYEYLINKDKKTVTYVGYAEAKFGDTKRMSITTYTLPEAIDGYRVTALYEYAFSYWKSLSDLTLPKTLKTIGSYAFNNCMSLRRIEIPEGVTELAANAFSVSGLEIIILPKSVKKIDNKAFDGCNYLKSVIVVKGSYAEKFCKKNNLPYAYEEKTETPEPTEVPTAEPVPEPTLTPLVDLDEEPAASEVRPETDSGPVSAGGKENAWFDYGVGAMLPKPQLVSGEEPVINKDSFINSRVGLNAMVTNGSDEDLASYAVLLKEFGFTIEDRSNIHIEAVNHNDGCKIYVIYMKDKGLEFSCMGPTPVGVVTEESVPDETVPAETPVLPVDGGNEGNNSGETSGITLLGIPWGGSHADYCAELVKQGFVDEFYYDFLVEGPLDYASLYPGDEDALKAFAPRAGCPYCYTANGMGGQSVAEPVKMYGGLVVEELAVYYYYDIDQAGRPDEQASHTYAATVVYKGNQNGAELLEKLKQKYGEPELQEGDNLRAYIWSDAGTRLVYYMDEQDTAYALWFIKPDVSLALEERIRNYTGPELEDAGL